MSGMNPKRIQLHKSLLVHVLIGIAAGIALGYLSPEYGAAMRPLGDGFIKLVKMMIGPIIFSTVVVGIAQMGAIRDVGRIGFRALCYFEALSSLALIIGLIAVTAWKPGAGLTIDQHAVDLSSIAAYTSGQQKLHTVDFLMNVIPSTLVDAFARGEILQVLLISVFFGIAMLLLGDRVRPLVAFIEQGSHVLFKMVDLIMYLAPVGAFGAMAFTIGRYGIGTLAALGNLIVGVYVTCAIFVFLVLGVVARLAGFSIWKLLTYIREEVFIVLGTASSESVLPRIMEKLELAGCPKSIVGLVIPTGYSFNLDGTSIYMTMAVRVFCRFVIKRHEVALRPIKKWCLD